MDEPLADGPVVDVDVHLSISTERLAEHLDPPLDRRVRARAPYLSEGWDRYIHEKIESRDASSPEAIREGLCEAFSVDRPVLNPTLQLPRVPEASAAAELMSAFNDVLVSDFLDADDDFAGLAVVSPRNPERSAEELDRLAGEPGVVGAFVPTTGTSPPMGDPRYDVIHRAAADNGLPVAYHAAAGSFVQDFPVQRRALDSFMAVHPLAHLWSQTLTLTSLLVNGVPEKFPELDFVFLETGGISWIPFVMFRLNKEYAIRRSEAPLLQRTPESYIRDSFYFSTQPFDEPDDPADLQRVLETVGADRIMFSSDYPHWDFDDLTSVGGQVAAAFPEAEREAVFGGNATEVFGL